MAEHVPEVWMRRRVLCTLRVPVGSRHSRLCTYLLQTPCLGWSKFSQQPLHRECLATVMSLSKPGVWLTQQSGDGSLRSHCRPARRGGRWKRQERFFNENGREHRSKSAEKYPSSHSPPYLHDSQKREAGNRNVKQGLGLFGGLKHHFGN